MSKKRYKIEIFIYFFCSPLLSSLGCTWEDAFPIHGNRGQVAKVVYGHDILLVTQQRVQVGGGLLVHNECTKQPIAALHAVVRMVAAKKV